MQISFREKVVETHAESLKVIANPGHDFIGGILFEVVEAVIKRHVKKFIALKIDDFTRNVVKIRALVAVFRERNIFTEKLEISCLSRFSQVRNLQARIVDIILALNVPAREFEDSCN